MSPEHNKSIILTRIQEAGSRGCSAQELVDGIHEWEAANKGVTSDADGIPDVSVEDVRSILEDLVHTGIIRLSEDGTATLIEQN